MGLGSFLRKTFGTCGTFRVEAQTLDGRRVSGTIYLETFGASNNDVCEYIQQAIWVKYGERVHNVRIVGFLED